MQDAEGQTIALLEQHLTNTLSNVSEIRSESEKKLADSQNSPEFPMYLLKIMAKNDCNGNLLDLVASTQFVLYIRNKFKGLAIEIRTAISENLLKLLIQLKHHKVANELLKGAQLMAYIDFPNSVLMKESLILLNHTSYGSLSNEKKSMILQLIYGLLKDIYIEKFKIQSFKADIEELFAKFLREKLQSSLVEIIVYFEKMRDMVAALVNQNNIGEGGLQLLRNCAETSAISLSKWILKILSLQNRVLPQYHLLTEAKVIKLSQDLHTIYYQLLASVLNKNLAESPEIQKFTEEFLYLIKQAEKILFKSLEERIVSLKEAQEILKYFYDYYFAPKSSILFYGGKVVDLDSLNQEKYILRLRESLIIPVMKAGETNLLLQSIKAFTNVLEFFGYNNQETLLWENEIPEQMTAGASIKGFFLENFQNIINYCSNTFLMMDYEDFFKLNFEAEDYYGDEINRAPDYDLRENAMSLIKLIMDYVDENLIYNHTLSLVKELEPSSNLQITTVKDALRKESCYYFLNKMYKDTKNHYEFKEVFVKYIASDLAMKSPLYDVIKCQIVLYLSNYLQSLYQIEKEEKRFYFIEICRSLAQENTVNVCVSLLALKTLLVLFDIDFSLTKYFDELIEFIIKLMSRTSNLESRITILGFLEVSLRENFKGSYDPLWSFSEEFFKLQGESKDFLTVRSKFVDLVSKLVKYDQMPEQDQTKNTTKQVLAIKYLDCCLEIESLSEIFLFESGLILFFRLLNKLSEKTYHQQIAESIAELLKRFDKFVQTKIDHLPSLFLIFMSAMNLGSLPVTKTVATIIADQFGFLLKEVRDDAIGIMFGAIDYLAICNRECYALIMHTLLSKGIRCILDDPKSENYVLKRNLLNILARGVFVLGNQFADLSKKLDETYSTSNVLFEFYLKCCEFIPETVYCLQSDKKFCMILGLFLFKDTLGQIQESMNSLQISQIDLNSKYSKVEKCTIILRSLATIGHSYQENQQKLLCKGDHWVHVSVEEGVHQDTLLEELTTVEIGRAIQLIHQDKLLEFDIIAEVKALVAANYELLMQNKNELIELSLKVIAAI